MLRITDIQNRLKESEGGIFQKVCNEILSMKGYKPFKLSGSVLGSNKTRKGTPDSIYIDDDNKYIYVEITTEQGDLSKKIIGDVKKCLDKINDNIELNGKISRILFLHNQENIDEILNEKIREMCGSIKFDIYGIETISSLLQTDFPELAITDLGVKEDFSMIDNISENALNQIARKISSIQNGTHELHTIDEIKSQINKYYEQAIKIVNSDDAMVYISDDDKKCLKSIFDGLKALEFYYKDKNDAYSRQYYHNMLVIISKYNYLEGVQYYHSIPEYAQKNNITLHFYSMLLIEKGDLEESKTILEKLYFNEKYEDSFETLLRTYFLSREYGEVVRLLSPAELDKFDKYGFLASILILSKNTMKKYEESEILRLNNSKFKRMPLFYTCTSKMLYELDRRKNKYKEQFKKCIKYLHENDIFAIITMCNQAIEIKLEDVAISYLESINLTPLLQKKLIEMLSMKSELNDKEIEILKNADLSLLDEKTDVNYLNAKISESIGKELEAINFFKKSFDMTENVVSLSRYIQLSIKNKSRIDDKDIKVISNCNNVSSLMLSAAAYEYMCRYDESLYCSYKAIYMSDRTYKFRDAYKQFWTINMMYNNDIIPKSITQNCVVILDNSRNNKKIYLLEDDVYFDEGKKILNAEIIRTDSYIGLELLQKEKNELVNINGIEYKIIDILNKYVYLTTSSFKYVNDNKYVKVFTSKKDDSEDSIDQIKQEMIEVKKRVDNKLDNYQNSKSLPLSSLINMEKKFEDYAKLINTLLLDKDRILLAGEPIDLNLSEGFVFDISTLIVLSIMGILDIISDSFCDKIYITMSLKNKFKYFYNNLLKKSNLKESTLCIVDDNKLFLNETQIIDKIKFWKKLNNYVDKFQVVNVEAENDELYNKNTEKFFDKTQFDLIELAKEKNIPLVSDDLIIRKLCNSYNVRHTNIIQIIKCFSKNDEEYFDVFIKLAKGNYIYTLGPNTLSYLIKKLYENFNDENQKKFVSVIESLFENEVSAKYYLPIFITKINYLKSVQYIKIYGDFYENSVVTFIIKEINKIVINKCEKFDIDINNYR